MKSFKWTAQTGGLHIVCLPASQEQVSLDYLPAKHGRLCKDSWEISSPGSFYLRTLGSIMEETGEARRGRLKGNVKTRVLRVWCDVYLAWTLVSLVIWVEHRVELRQISRSNTGPGVFYPVRSPSANEVRAVRNLGVVQTSRSSAVEMDVSVAFQMIRSGRCVRFLVSTHFPTDVVNNRPGVVICAKGNADRTQPLCAALTS